MFRNFLTTKEYLSFNSLILFSCFWLLSFSIYSQNIYRNPRVNNWAFQKRNGIHFNSGSPTTFLLDSAFATTTPTPVGLRGTSCISDTNGNLLLYSNGQIVRNANGTILMNGSGLGGSQEACQSSIFIPSPSPLNPTRYYLITNDSFGVGTGTVLYEIELSLNMVLPNPPVTLIDSSTEKLAATKHADGKSYWVVGHHMNNNDFYAYLIDESGLNATPVISSVGIVHSVASSIGETQGNLKISPDGTKIATANFHSGTVQLFDFDNSTGIVSNAITLSAGTPQFISSVEFSADSKKLYFGEDFNNAVTNYVPKIHEFDLDHVSIDCLLASEYIFDHNDPFKQIKDIQLAGDKKIYVNYYEGASTDSLGIIHRPNEIGSGNNYQKNGLRVAQNMNNFGGLPNFVSSFLSDGIYVEFGTNCEGIITEFRPQDTLGVDSVIWNFGDPTSSNNTSTNLNATHLFSSGNDTFLVVLVSFHGNQADTFAREVIVWSRDLHVLGNDTTVCAGQQVTLDATYFNACIVWNDGSTNNTISTNQEGWYWADVSYQSCLFRDSVYVTEISSPPNFSLGNDTSICTGLSFTLDPNAPNAFYTWSDGSHDTTFVVDTLGTFWLSASNACGSFADTINVTLNLAAQPHLSFPSDTISCDTVPFTFDISFLGANYTWNDGFNGPIRTFDETGLYIATVANACDTVSDTMNLVVHQPIVSNILDRYVLCPGNDTVPIGKIQNQISAIWSNGDVGDSAFYSISDSGFVIASNVCGQFIDSFEVLLWDTNYTLFIGTDTTVCSDTNTVLIGDFQNDYPFIYSWNTDETDALIAPTSGEYTVTAANRCASITASIVLELAQKIGIQRPNNFIICPDETKTISIDFTEVKSVNWSTGDTSKSVRLPAAGIYSVEIIDTNGCYFSEEISFSDSCPGKVTVPNIFTPNGDGVNDEFCLKLENISEFNFWIFDRWGIEVYQTSHNGECWDGKTTLNQANNGVYFYVLETIDALGETASFRGSFTLLR